MKNFETVLQNETYTDVETLAYLLERITEKYGVKLNLTDLAGIGTMDHRLDDLFRQYNYHNNSFCNMVKKSRQSFHRCIEAKSNLCQAFETRKHPFFGKCYLGIAEFYYPVRFNNKLIALICVGQFAIDPQKEIAHLRREVEKYGLDAEAYSEEYLAVTKEIDFPPEELNRDLWTVCNFIALFYQNEILQKAQVASAIRTTSEYYQDRGIVSAAMEFIKENYPNKLSLDLIAAHCYCNPTYLSHLFKKETGFTTTDYINQCRVEQAKHLLDITDLTVTQIAGQVGFESSSYFSKVFHALEGVYPTHYRDRTSQK